MTEKVPTDIEEELLSRENVIGVGIGVKQTEKQRVGDSQAIVVYVKEKYEEDKLDDRDIVPKEVTIEGAEIKTDVVESGVISLETQPLRAQSADENQIHQDISVNPEYRKQRIRPAPAGVSCGHPNATAGTIGTSLLETESGETVVLTNSHVAAEMGKATSGDPFLQPGPSDGGQDPQDRIGSLLDFSTISTEEANRTDSALISVDATAVSNEFLGIRKPLRGWTNAIAGQEYIKSGRSSGVTQGKCISTNTTFNVRISTKTGESNQAQFVGVDVFERMTLPGDSGCLYGREESNGYYGTSLHFAGGKVSVGIPLQAIEEEHGSLTPITSSPKTPNQTVDTGIHFSEDLEPNESSSHWSGPWASEYIVDFHVQPLTQEGIIRYSVDTVRKNSGGKWYKIEVKNMSSSPVSYKTRYRIFPT